MPQLSFENVSMDAGGCKLLTDFNLILDKKELLVILGTGGCGKITAIRLLAGLEELSSGRILLDGDVINSSGKRYPKITGIFGTTSLHPGLTAAQNLAIPLYGRKVPVKDQKSIIIQIAKTIGLGSVLNFRVMSLSRMRQKLVAFGQAVNTYPEYLLIDDVFFLDRSGKTLISRQQLKDLYNEQNYTIIYATANPVDAMEIATKIVVLQNGVIQQFDSPANIYCMPRNYFVAELVGTPRMNFFMIRPRKEKGETNLTNKSFSLRLPDIFQSRMLKYINKPFILGIRPEDIRHPLGLPDDFIGSEIQVMLEASKVYKGNSIHYLLVGKNHFLARMNTPHKFPPGQRMPVMFDMRKIHLFDPSIDPENPPGLAYSDYGDD